MKACMIVLYVIANPKQGNIVYKSCCTLITFTSKAPPRDLYPMVHQGKLVVLRGTPSKPVVIVVQQLVLKNGYHMVAVPSRSKKKEGVKL